MSSSEREKRPLYGARPYGGRLWLIDPETGEKIRWLGDESSGRKEKNGAPQEKDLPELRAPEGGPAWPPSRVNDDS